MMVALESNGNRVKYRDAIEELKEVTLTIYGICKFSCSARAVISSVSNFNPSFVNQSFYQVKDLISSSKSLSHLKNLSILKR
jgi:hypothetical protein